MARFTGPQATVSSVSTANAINTITLTNSSTPGPNQSAAPYFIVTAFSVYLTAAAAANDVNCVLKSGSRVMWQAVIGSGAARGAGIAQQVPIDGWPADPGASVTLTVDAGGAGAITVANLSFCNG